MKAPPVRESVTVRPAVAADSRRIAELAGQLGYPSTPEEVSQRLRGINNPSENAVFVAALPDGEIAGWLGVFVYRCVEADVRAEVSGLVVDERFRSRGIGLRLLEQAEQWARDRNCVAIGLRSNVIRDRAHAFYEEHGYQLVKTQKAFRKPL